MFGEKKVVSPFYSVYFSQKEFIDSAIKNAVKESAVSMGKKVAEIYSIKGRSKMKTRKPKESDKRRECSSIGR